MIEQILADFEIAHQIRPAILRYFNVAGADPDVELGEHHEPETHLIPSVIHAALGIRPEITVYGTDFPSKDGSAIRDYIHVSDLAQAHVQALKYLMNEKKSLCVNLGTGTGYSVLEIIDAVHKFCGKSIPVRLERRRPGEPSNLTADSALAKKLLNWTPVYSELPFLIESAWKWHQFLSENSTLLEGLSNSFQKKVKNPNY